MWFLIEYNLMAHLKSTKYVMEPAPFVRDMSIDDASILRTSKVNTLGGVVQIVFLSIDLFRYIIDAPAPMTSVARVRENVFLSVDLARMTREPWRTKGRRRPRRVAESLRSSHAVESVGVERRVSPPPRRGAMLTFRPSLPDQMIQETGKRPNGAVAAILAVRPP